MNFICNDGCAKHWRIRHGAADRDADCVPLNATLMFPFMRYNGDLILRKC